MRKLSQRSWAFAAVAVVASAFLFSPAASWAQPATAGDAQVRSGKVVIGQWTERVKLEGGGTEVTQVTALYDWTSGKSYREIRNEKGRLVHTLKGRKAPRPFPEEIEAAFSMVYDDEALGSLIRQQRLQVDGGFLLEQARGQGPCSLGSRCIQVFLFDGINVARHTVVDLKTNQIVYRDYVPQRNRISR